jgi:hypothetical protein
MEFKKSASRTSNHEFWRLSKNEELAAGCRRSGGRGVQGLGYQSPSRLVRLCQTIFYKKYSTTDPALAGQINTDGAKARVGTMTHQCQWIPAVSNGFQRFPINSNQFQSLLKRIMKRSAENLNEACLAGWTASVGSERGLAGESGVAAPALPPQSKTRWLQPVLPWAEDTMCRGWQRQTA